MKKCCWILALVMVSVLVCASLAVAQEKAAEPKKVEKSEKQIVIKLPEGMGEGMPGCQMMGQMGQSPSCMMMGPAGGCGMGQMQGGAGCCGRGCCGMGSAGPKMMCKQMGAGMGCGMGQMGACGGMGCGMACGPMGRGAAGGMCEQGCGCKYLKCAEALELTQKQIGDLKAICSAAKKAMIRKQADIKVAESELKEIMDEDVLDFAKAKAKITEISDLKAGIQIDRLTNMQKAQKVLTAEQLKKCKAMCASACGQGQQIRKCVKIMKAPAKGTEGTEDVEMEEEEGGN